MRRFILALTIVSVLAFSAFGVGTAFAEGNSGNHGTNCPLNDESHGQGHGHGWGTSTDNNENSAWNNCSDS